MTGYDTAPQHPEPPACPECDQCARMIRTAEAADETDLARTLTGVLTQHRARHHPTTAPNTRLRSLS